MADSPYLWAYAPSNRAKCKGKCGKNIEKGAIKFGVSREGGGDYNVTTWKNLGCVTKKVFENVEAKVGSIENVTGFDTLTPEDQDAVREAMEAAKNAAPAPKAKKTPAQRLTTPMERPAF